MSIPFSTIYYPLTSQPTDTTSYTFNNLPDNNSNISFDTNNGLNLDANLNPPQGNGKGTKRQFIVPISSSNFNSGITVSFRVKLSFINGNTNALRIFTHGSNFPTGFTDTQIGQIYKLNETIQIQHGSFASNTSKVWIALSITNSIIGQKSTNLQSPVMISVNTWYLITYTITPVPDRQERLIKFYVNGNAITDSHTGIVNGSGSTPCTTATKMCTTVHPSNINIRTSSSNPAILPQYLRLGDRYDARGYGMSGYVRDLMVWNTPLSQNQINYLFNTIYSSPTSAMLISEQLVLGPPCDNWKVYQGGEICSCNIENAIVNDTICPIDSNSKNYKFNNTIGAAGYRPDNHPDVWTLVGPVPISPFTSKITNNIENFSDINLNNNFVLYTNIYSIIGIIFYTILYIANINYDNVIKNKIISFALNVLLVICIIISISIIKD
jgi:hypothetical protein